MALARSLLIGILVMFLGFSHLICLNAVPVTRTRTLMHENVASLQPLKQSNLGITEGIMEEKLIKGRIDIELQDYPGSGANNRHTPRAQSFRGCDDC